MWNIFYNTKLFKEVFFIEYLHLSPFQGFWIEIRNSCLCYILFTDIQEFYELTLLDDTKSIQQKTVETLQIATKWEQENSLKINAEVSLPTKNRVSQFVLWKQNCFSSKI